MANPGFRRLFHRICIYCEESFLPKGKRSKVCSECIKKNKKEGWDKRDYSNIKFDGRTRLFNKPD